MTCPSLVDKGSVRERDLGEDEWKGGQEVGGVE